MTCENLGNNADWVSWMMKCEEQLGTNYYIDELSMHVIIQRGNGQSIGCFTEEQAECFFMGLARYNSDVVYGDWTADAICRIEEDLEYSGAGYYLQNRMTDVEWYCYVLGWAEHTGLYMIDEED